MNASRASRLLGGQLPFQGVQAGGEGFEVVRSGHSHPLEYLVNSYFYGSTELFTNCLAFLLHTGLEDAQLDEGMVDPAIDLGLEFLTGLFGTAGEFGLKLLRFLFGKLGPAPTSAASCSAFSRVRLAKPTLAKMVCFSNSNMIPSLV